MAKLYVRNAGLEAREIDNDIFLIDEEGGGIHHLNSTGAAVWRLLERPLSKGDITGIMRMAFPLEDAEHISTAVKKLLKRMRNRGLIERK